jgi:leader peptidase (prepilin peptidase)/N-methyltransferase
MMRILGTIFAALLGLAFGSFLNVCLSRWPDGESIVQPRSHCRNCTHTLAWWENVPLVSWLALRGRCRNCRTWIGWRYPLVELAVGVLWAVYAWQFFSAPWDPNATAINYSLGLLFICGRVIFSWLLLALAVLDAENLWLPDWLTLPGIALGFIIRLVTIVSIATGPGTDAFENVRHGAFGAVFQRLLGILAAAGLILLIRWIYWLVRRREGVGLGDAKLMAMLAAWLGLPGALLAFGLAVVLGAGVALVLLAIPSRTANSNAWALKKLPLGTFLCVGGVVSGLWGQRIIAAYLRWSGL